MFSNRTYKLHRRHRPNMLIIIEPHISEDRAQAVIDSLPYTHSHRVDPTSYSGDIQLLWNESPSFMVEIITRSEHSIHALVKVHSPLFPFYLLLFTPHPSSISANFSGIIFKILLGISLSRGFSWVILMICFRMMKNQEAYRLIELVFRLLEMAWISVGSQTQVFMARVSLGPRKAQCGKPQLKSDWTEDWEMPNGQCSFLLSKFTISLGLSLTTALSCLTLTILNGNLPNLFDLSKCGSPIPPFFPLYRIAGKRQS